MRRLAALQDPRQAIRSDLEARLECRRAEHAGARRAESAAGNLAVALLLVGLGLLGFSSNLGSAAVWVGGAALVALVPVVAWRGRLTRRRRRLGYAVEWMERAAQRLEDRFEFGQEHGGEFKDPSHPYAGDLDVLGAGSLFHRLNGCQTLLGRRALAALLTGELPGDSPDDRRSAVEELRDATQFRESFEVELRTVGEIERSASVDAVRLRRDTEALLAWGREPAPPAEPGLRILFHAALALLATGAVAVKFVFDLPWGVALPFYALNFLVLSRQKDIEALEGRFSTIRVTLQQWSRAIRCLEDYAPQGSLLRDARGRLLAQSVPSSQAIARLGSLVDQLSRRRNVIWVLTFGVLWLWDLHARRRLFAWQREHGPHLREWLDSVALVEGLCSLGAYAEAVPEQCYAEFTAQGAWFTASSLCHPLLPRKLRVGNDVELAAEGSVLLVTGSNMSGKSTLLRACGLAAVMARLGLPVPAAALRLREIVPATCMRVEDSLQEGSSRFHAEVKRLKFCVDRAAAGPATLVILDEILAGTNSRDRHQGTLAVLRRLTEVPAVTLVSTHDLELVALREAHPGKVDIAHFRDTVQDGVMTFDYRLRPGALPASNALEVMRLAGIEVAESA